MGKYTTYLNTHIFSLFIIQMRFLMQFQFEGKTKFSSTDFALMHQFGFLSMHGSHVTPEGGVIEFLVTNLHNMEKNVCL